MRNFRQSTAKGWQDVYFCFEQKHRHKHAKTPHLNRKEGHRPKITKNTLFHERTRKDKVFKHVQKFASSFLTLKSRCTKLTPAPQVRPPSVISGADPKCKGLTCFSKTQNEKSRSTSPYMMTDPLP